MGKNQFISLLDALNIIAESTQITPFPLDSIPPTAPAYSFWNSHIREIEEERKFSMAAELLNTAMRQSDNPPKWYEYTEKERCAFPNDSAEQGGRQILISAINVASARQKERQDHLFQCLKDGLDPLEKPILFSVAKQEWQPGNPVGLDRSELINFLNRNNIAHPFEYDTVQNADETEQKEINNHCDEPETNSDRKKNECRLDPMKAIVSWKAIGNALGKSPDYAKKYCKKNGIRIEHDSAGKPWTTLEEIARSRVAK